MGKVDSGQQAMTAAELAHMGEIARRVAELREMPPAERKEHLRRSWLPGYVAEADREWLLERLLRCLSLVPYEAKPGELFRIVGVIPRQPPYPKRKRAVKP